MKFYSLLSFLLLFSCTDPNPAINLPPTAINPSSADCTSIISGIKKLNSQISIEMLTENLNQIACQNADPKIVINYGIGPSDNEVNTAMLSTIHAYNAVIDADMRRLLKESIKATALSYDRLALDLTKSETVISLDTIRQTAVLSSRSLVTAKQVASKITDSVSSNGGVSYLSSLDDTLTVILSLPDENQSDAFVQVSNKTAAQLDVLKTTLQTPSVPTVIPPSFVSRTGVFTALADGITLPFILNFTDGKYHLDGTIQADCILGSDRVQAFSDSIPANIHFCENGKLNYEITFFSDENDSSENFAFRFDDSSYSILQETHYAINIHKSSMSSIQEDDFVSLSSVSSNLNTVALELPFLYDDNLRVFNLNGTIEGTCPGLSDTVYLSNINLTAGGTATVSCDVSTKKYIFSPVFVKESTFPSTQSFSLSFRKDGSIIDTRNYMIQTKDISPPFISNDKFTSLENVVTPLSQSSLQLPFAYVPASHKFYLKGNINGACYPNAVSVQIFSDSVTSAVFPCVSGQYKASISLVDQIVSLPLTDSITVRFRDSNEIIRENIYNLNYIDVTDPSVYSFGSFEPLDGSTSYALENSTVHFVLNESTFKYESVGYFTGSCPAGATKVRAFSASMTANIFSCDAATHLFHYKALLSYGSVSGTESISASFFDDYFSAIANTFTFNLNLVVE